MLENLILLLGLKIIANFGELYLTSTMASYSEKDTSILLVLDELENFLNEKAGSLVNVEEGLAENVSGNEHNNVDEQINQTVDQKQSYICSSCNFPAKSERGLNTHINRQHMDKNSVMCDVCSLPCTKDDISLNLDLQKLK